MSAVLLLTTDPALRARVEPLVAASSLFAAASEAEALETLRAVTPEVVLVDGERGPRDLAEFVRHVRALAPEALVVALGGEDEAAAADVVLPRPGRRGELERGLQLALDRHRLAREVAALRARLGTAPAPGPAEPAPLGGLARILTEFTRVFAAGFDPPRATEMFLDAVAGLVRPARLALLCPDESRLVFRVAAHRGLAAALVTGVRLSATSGLGRWLALQGRPARLPELDDRAAARELALLGGVLAVPLLAHGELAGLLVVGPPVVGEAYGRAETETLFDLATHFATGLRAIALHQRLAREKEFTEQILASMSSGVVTLGRDERIGLVNRRAEEILGLPAVALAGQDLRALPSPLGDLLYETLVSGRARRAEEVHLAQGDRWLEVTTYPIGDKGEAPLGAVLVFDDHTARRELAAQQRRAEQAELLARVVARIADEIKNPLVSIHTFVELLEERYDQADFRKHFATVVRRDVGRLVQVLEKLGGLVDVGTVDCSTVDMRAVVDEVVAALDPGAEGFERPLRVELEGDAGPCLARADRARVGKALAHLVWHLAHRSPGDEARVAIALARQTDPERGAVVRVAVSSRTAVLPPEQDARLFDPLAMVQESLLELGPAVSRRLVEAMGGQLALRRGRQEVAFQVTLPAA